MHGTAPRTEAVARGTTRCLDNVYLTNCGVVAIGCNLMSILSVVDAGVNRVGNRRVPAAVEMGKCNCDVHPQ